MRLWPDTILGRTLAAMLAGIVLVAGFLLVQLYWERQAMLSSIGGWHVVTRIAGVVEEMDITPPENRRAALAAYQGAGFRVVWNPESPLPPHELDWRGRLVRDALASQLGGLGDDAVRIGWGTLAPPAPPPGMQGGGMPQNMARMQHGHDEVFQHRLMVISLRLKDTSWLSFATPPAPGVTLWKSRIFWGVALGVLIVVAASIWAVGRATQPLDLFARAAVRLGTDVNAEPLAETGPREVRRAARAFNRMQSRLQAFVKDRTHMLAAISHDLRTPITRLRLRAEFIEDGEQRAKMLTDLDEMEAMIAATLQFARDDAMNEPTARLDLAALVRELADGDTCEAPARLEFVGRPLGLRRMIGNLIGNARRYGERVEVGLSNDGESARLVVRDDGPGIPEDMLDKVFDPFVRVEGSRSRETGGVGLGLSAVRTIAQAHGGQVTLKNRAEGGLEACVTLPLAG